MRIITPKVSTLNAKKSIHGTNLYAHEHNIAVKSQNIIPDTQIIVRQIQKVGL